MHDPRWPGGPRPDLRRLPQVIREQISQPIPLRPNEVKSEIRLFKSTPGLRHPHGRLNVSEYRKDADNFSGAPDGVQIDAADFYGRTPLVSVLLRKEAIAPILENMIRSYLATGATLEAVQELVSRAQLPLEKLQATTYYEDEGSRE